MHAVILTAEGADFSYGASVAEHAPGPVREMLPLFSGLFRTIARAGVPLCAAVRGRCLGGGLELALAAHRILVAADAQLGLPEVKLGVFPPVAAAVLPLRVPQPVVDRLVMTGATVSGVEAVHLGLADQACAAEALEEEALAWARTFVELSGSSLRFATRAARAAWNEALGVRLERLEHLYLGELMDTRDAHEGIRGLRRAACARLGGPMRTPEAIAAECEDIVLDTHLERVRSWRAETGKKAVGFLPVYAPSELIEAADMLSVGVAGGGGQVEIIRGDAFFQSYICALPRSVIEMGLSKRLDCLDGMIFPATCDVIRNLSGMWKMLFPDTWVHYLDVPHNHDPDVGGRFYENELRTIAAELAALSGVEVTEERLRDAIARRNESRLRIDALYDLRAQEPHRVPTAEAYVLLRAGYQLPVDAHVALLDEYLAAARAADRPERDQARVLLVGAFCEQPPLGLIRTLERAGCYIVDDDLLLGAHFIRGALPTDGDPFRALVDAWVHRAEPTPSRYVPGEKKGQWLVERCRARGAEGVVFCAPSFCDPALLEQPMLQVALDDAGIAYTTFKYSESSAQFHAIHEQSGTFADSIKLWSEAS